MGVRSNPAEYARKNVAICMSPVKNASVGLRDGGSSTDISVTKLLLILDAWMESKSIL
jgi:hypothetical protein